MSKHVPIHQTRGILLMLVSVLIWGGWVVASRAGTQDNTMNAFDIVAVRFMVAGIIFLPIVIKRGMGFGPYGVLSAIIAMCLMGAPYNVMTIYALGFTPASHSSIIYAVSTAFSCIIGMVVLKEPSTILRWCGVMLGASGIILLVYTRSTEGVTIGIGHVLFMIGGCTWGLYTVLARVWRPDAIHASAAMTVFSMLFYLPVYYFFLPKQIMHAEISQIVWQGFYQGILTNVVALAAYYKAIEYLGASGAGAFVPLVPVCAALMAVGFLGEIPSLVEWIGILTAAVGVLFASGVVDKLRERRRLRRARLGTPSQSDIPA